MELVFGPSTLLGTQVTFQFPEITNNQSLLWYHSHNMFISMELVYGGIVGLLQIVDKKTEWLTNYFQYGDNNILLEALDMDLTSTGKQTFANLVTDENRSNFTVINGTSVLNWYSSDPVPFVNPLYHKSTKNLVKIDILNASLNWRVFHLGVCDKHYHSKPFYIVQTDSGLINPREQEYSLKGKKLIKIPTYLKDREEREENIPKPKEVFVVEAEDHLQSILGTKVKIHSGKIKSKIEIEFYSEEDLERILETLTKPAVMQSSLKQGQFIV